jgi:hypothetical protein
MERDGRDVQLAAGGALVEGLDVGELVDELESAVVDLPSASA